MLLPLVSEQVIAAREALEVVAARVLAEERHLRTLVGVFILMAMEILRVQKALVAYMALVWAFGAIEMGLSMAAGDNQHTLAKRDAVYLRHILWLTISVHKIARRHLGCCIESLLELARAIKSPTTAVVLAWVASSTRSLAAMRCLPRPCSVTWSICILDMRLYRRRLHRRFVCIHVLNVVAVHKGLRIHVVDIGENWRKVGGREGRMERPRLVFEHARSNVRRLWLSAC